MRSFIRPDQIHEASQVPACGNVENQRRRTWLSPQPIAPTEIASRSTRARIARTKSPALLPPLSLQDHRFDNRLTAGCHAALLHTDPLLPALCPSVWPSSRPAR